MANANELKCKKPLLLSFKPPNCWHYIKPKNLVIVDASNGIDAKSNYTKNHLEGALFVDLNTQLSNIKADVSDGGRHPLPGFEQFSNTLTALGISSNSHVVIYDDKKGSNAAARFWWMLKSIGHKRVQVLNGDVQEAERINFPMSSKIENIRKSKPYKIENWKLPLAQIEEVEKISQDANYKVIDVREAARYNGTFEPIDLIAGHIPGAINIPFSENLDKNGLFLSANRLKEKYQ